VAGEGEMLLDGSRRPGRSTRARNSWDEGRIAAVAKGKRVSCEDCYFKRNGLCALNSDKPCATFRCAERGLRPERQLAFVFRTERTRAVYAFPQPQ
jgi:hypothetical protein